MKKHVFMVGVMLLFAFLMSGIVSMVEQKMGAEDGYHDSSDGDEITEGSI